MLTPEEKKFLYYWENNREKDKNVWRQLRHGLPVGIFLGILIVLNFTSGWYSRAVMVANSQSTPLVLLIGVAAIIVFWSIFSKKHRWEMNEQRYKELQYKQNKAENFTPVQQEQIIIGQDKNEQQL